jgi:hypothetical protein
MYLDRMKTRIDWLVNRCAYCISVFFSYEFTTDIWQDEILEKKD